MFRPFRRLAPQDHVANRDMVLGRLWLLRNGVASQAMETLAAGPFLAACAVYLGASNIVIGMLAAVPHLIQFAQLFGVWLVERTHARRSIAVIAGSVGRFSYVGMIAAMFVPETGIALAILVASVALRYTAGAVVTAAWNAWIPDIVPADRRGEYFAKRLRLMAIVGTGLSLLAALLVDQWQAHDAERGMRHAYAVLFAIAGVSGVLSVYCMTRMPDPRMPERAERFPFSGLLAQPFRNANFRRLMAFMVTWNFATNLAAPFFTVYMLRRLGFDLTFITVLMILSQFANVTLMRVWGRIADRYANKSVLAVCGPLFIACIFAWTFTTFPERHFLTIPLLVAIHLLTGIATAGVTLASTSIGMKLAPAGQTNTYLAASSILNSLAAGIAPVIGGLTADFFLNRELSLVLHWTAPDGERNIPALFLEGWDFFFVLAAVIGLFSLHRLSLVQESGQQEQALVLHDVMAETRRTIRSFSTVAGLKAMTELPLNLVQRSLRRRR